MPIFKCKMCGGDLNISEGATVAECEFCGTKQTVSTANDEIVQNLFNRANNLRIKCEFDKAEQVYEKILNENDKDSEAHWGIVLCKYGIEYVEDPKTYKRIPTCHRTSFQSVITDTDYLSAIENADSVQKSIYEAEARAIDEIQKNILSIVENEEPFDVFICYKETDENGNRTVDSTVANDIYYQLTQEGLKVFFFAITLEDKLGQEYEPYIFSALNSAKVMLVIGTKPEYFNAVWVKNEWSRFLKLMKSDRSKLLIPCYRDMDAYDLPEEFAHLQAQDMGKIAFMQDLIRGIKKITKAEAPKPTVVKETVISGGNANTAPLLKRAFMFLEDGDWNSADEYCEKVLDIEPECAEAYLGKLLSELRVRKQEALKDQAEPFDNSNNYQKAVRFADEKLKSTLTGYIDYINTRNEKTRLETLYNSALDLMSNATDENDFLSAAETFEKIKNYEDSLKLAEECRASAENAYREHTYDEATWKMECEIYGRAIELFESISGYKDSNQKILECKQKLDEIKKKAEKNIKKLKKASAIFIPVILVITAFIIVLNTVIIPNNKYNDAVALMKEGKYENAITTFEKLDGYKDSATKITECKSKITECKYNDAIALMEAGNIVEAYEALTALDGYKDSVDKANSIYYKYKLEGLKVIKTGDNVSFGTYEQDNNIDNGQEEIEWLVLDKKDSKILLISKCGIDCKPYNTDYTDVTWKNCTLRKWLNNNFINSAFNEEEKSMIPTVTVTADNNPDYSTDPGNATQDRVFLLSITEVNKYFASDDERKCKPTAYAVANGAGEYDSGNCWWWLRSPGNLQVNAANVYNDGDVDEYGNYVYYDYFAVRPALWIDLNS